MEINKIKNDNPPPETATLISMFEKESAAFYDTASDYLKKWSVSFDKYEVFDWMTLSQIPEWEKIENTILYLQNNGVELSDNLFEQHMYLKSFVEAKLASDSEDWNTIKSVEEKWLFFF